MCVCVCVKTCPPAFFRAAVSVIVVDVVVLKSTLGYEKAILDAAVRFLRSRDLLPACCRNKQEGPPNKARKGDHPMFLLHDSDAGDVFFADERETNKMSEKMHLSYLQEDSGS